MKASVIIIGCAALIACGIANSDVSETQTRVKTIRLPAPPPRTITKIKTVRVSNPVPDGYMTKRDCKNLRMDADFRAIVAHYGWPHGSNGDDSDSINMYYPLSHDPESSSRCEITFYQGKVDFVDIDGDPA